MKNIAIVHPKVKTETMKRSAELLSEFLMGISGEYPFFFESDNIPELEDCIYIYFGTKENNPEIKKRSKAELSMPEEYSITVENEIIVVEGYDEIGAMYGAVDLYNKYFVPLKYKELGINDYSLFNKPLPNFSHTARPSVKERGIWTWGHVIYNYKGFLANMAKLKMNSLIMWNDFVPFNMKEILDLAHSYGIKVILGYSWGWDQKCREISLSTLNGKSEEIFAKYEKEYAGLDIDGIYFQTVTELEEEYIEGVLVADAVTDFVNKTAGLFYEKYPELLIEFGLHATSVKKRLEVIKRVDPRMRIIWEDFGAMPFSYNAADIKDYEATKELALDAATLRGKNDNFGVVTKANTCLDWTKFIHPKGPQNIGVATKAVIENRIERKSRVWRAATAGWLLNGEYALDTVGALALAKDGDLSVNALVEDGVFGERVMFPVALFAEMLWNTEMDLKKTVSDIALRDYVEFV